MSLIDRLKAIALDYLERPPDRAPVRALGEMGGLNHLIVGTLPEVEDVLTEAEEILQRKMT